MKNPPIIEKVVITPPEGAKPIQIKDRRVICIECGKEFQSSGMVILDHSETKVYIQCYCGIWNIIKKRLCFDTEAIKKSEQAEEFPVL